MEKQNESFNSNKKIRLKDTRIAYYWNLVLYILSAVTFADGLVSLSSKIWGGALNDFGLTLVFLVLSTRGEQIAAYAYIKDPEQMDKVIRALVENEKTRKPWLGRISAVGWGLMFAGIAIELLM